MARYAALSDRDVLPVMKLELGFSVPPASHICAQNADDTKSAEQLKY